MTMWAEVGVVVVTRAVFVTFTATYSKNRKTMRSPCHRTLCSHETGPGQGVVVFDSVGNDFQPLLSSSGAR